MRKHPCARINAGQSSLNGEGVVGILNRLAQRLYGVVGAALAHKQHSTSPLNVGVVGAEPFGALNGVFGFVELGRLHQVARHFGCKHGGVGVLCSAHVDGFARPLQLARLEVVVGDFFKLLHVKKQRSVFAQRLLKTANKGVGVAFVHQAE